MEHPEDGILLVDKEEGETSAEVVRRVKSAVASRSIRKVGHAGTLDPFASGLLIVLLGQGTKLSPFLMGQDKTYLATILLGTETDTLDSTGRVVHTSAIGELSLSRLEETALRFTGPIRQSPPAYSAVRYKGKRAYEMARRGEPVQLSERTVTVHELAVVSAELPEVTLIIRCSSGTYIRSLARDLGKALGTTGHARSLRRLASGPFHVGDAVASSSISGREGEQVVMGNRIPLREALKVMPEITVTEPLARKVRNGYQPLWDDLKAPGAGSPDCKGNHAKLIMGDELVAIVRMEGGEKEENARTRVIRVFL